MDSYSHREDEINSAAELVGDGKTTTMPITMERIQYEYVFKPHEMCSLSTNQKYCENAV